jgi:glutathione S-transferase
LHRNVLGRPQGRYGREEAEARVALFEGNGQDGYEAFGYLEGRSPERFLVGDALSIADLAVVSNLVVIHYLGHRIDGRRYPKLAAYFQKRAASSALSSVLDGEKPFVDGVAGLKREF